MFIILHYTDCKRIETVLFKCNARLILNRIVQLKMYHNLEYSISRIDQISIIFELLFDITTYQKS